MLHFHIGPLVSLSAVLLVDTHEGTSPTVQSLLDRVYAETIDLSELLNTLQGFVFPALYCRALGLLLDLGLWAEAFSENLNDRISN